MINTYFEEIKNLVPCCVTLSLLFQSYIENCIFREERC